MKSVFSIAVSVLVIAVLVITAGCSKDNKNVINNPGGPTREFSSGDLAQGMSFQHTFNTARTMNYYCAYHGGPGLQGMAATITVTSGGTAETRQVNITSSSLPNITVAVGSTIRWTNNHSMTHTVQSDN